MKMKVGYARVSTEIQNLDLQTRALTLAGCERIYEDCASGAKAIRPGLKAALRCLRDGDTLIVWRFDRLARSVPHLAQIVSGLQKRNIGFVSITEAIDTTSEIGLMMLYMLGAVAQFERALIRERIAAGLDAARSRGQQLGRRPALKPEEQKEVAHLYSSGELGTNELAARYQVHPRTIKRCLDRTFIGPPPVTRRAAK